MPLPNLTPILNSPTQHSQPLHGGQIGEVYDVTLADGRRIVAKVDHGRNPALHIEGHMLAYLAQHSQLPLPTLLHAAPNLLLMNHIDGESHFTPTAEQNAAHHLTQLHRLTAPQYGFHQDTLIGRYPQPNPWHNSWIAFFRDYRLLHRGRAALNDGLLPPHLFARLETFCAQLPHWLDEPPQPSLIHGDIWANNVLATPTHITGFIDPAIYYADAEIELAYIALCNTFGQPFFQRYNELFPIRAGFFEVRQHIYSLYPLLVHVHHFGGGYVGQVAQRLAQFGC